MATHPPTSDPAPVEAGPADVLPQDDRHEFNEDILLKEQNGEVARRRWPLVAPLLIHPELTAHFRSYEQRAKKYKAIVQWTGTAAVALMLAALAGAAVELQGPEAIPGPSGPVWVVLNIAGLLGLLAALLASRFGPFRRRWLKNRFRTEVLRQWHFRQLLDVSRFFPPAGPTATADEIEAEIDRAFEALLHDLRNAGPLMDGLVQSQADPLGALPDPRLPDHPDARRQVLGAYERLRIREQIGYARHKLSPEDRTFLRLSNGALVFLTDLVAGTTLTVALVLTVTHLVQPVPHAAFAAILLAILGVAVRAWRDGLALREERESYEEMLHRLLLLHARWQAAATDEQRFEHAAELEHIALQELRAFLRTHMKSQFLF